jgi:SAM-dependent methyltransferase
MLHVNYRFVVDFCCRNAPSGKILDYGCGSGDIVRAGLESGLDITGCETFYEGGEGTREKAADLIGSRIMEMKESRIPFPESSFDCVVNNMVLEHVADLDLALSEIRRVLKPGGIVLSLFPSREVLRENHCGVPLAHRFSRYRFGYYWLLAFRCIGVGYFTEGKTRSQWAEGFRNWLNLYCHYRPEQEIISAFTRHGLKPKGIEPDYMKFRGVPILNTWMFRRLGSLVLLSTTDT